MAAGGYQQIANLLQHKPQAGRYFRALPSLKAVPTLAPRAR